MNPFLRGAAAACLGATMMFLMPAKDAQAAPLCKRHFHQTEAFGGSQYQGLRKAKARWLTRVYFHDGDRWSSYSRACNKNERCSGRSGLYRCFVSGRPGRRP